METDVILRKPANEALCPRQIPHDRTWDRIRAATARSRRMAVERLLLSLYKFLKIGKGNIQFQATTALNYRAMRELKL
jgi:hypothetical protein